MFGNCYSFFTGGYYNISQMLNMTVIVHMDHVFIVGYYLANKLHLH